MGDARDDARDGDRLPWIEGSRAVPPAPSVAPPPVEPPPVKHARARRLAAGPILALLALFMTVGLALVAYLAGRETVSTAEAPPSPAPAPPQSSQVARVTLPEAGPAAAPAPTRAAPIAPPATANAPAPNTRPTVRRDPPRRVIALRVAPKPALKVERKVAVARPPPTPARTVRTAVRVPRARPPSPGKGRHYVAPLSPVPIRDGELIQLGVFRSGYLANASYRRLVAVYPYLRTLKKQVATAHPPLGYPRLYRLQLTAHSRRDAFLLCRNLIAIGRGCIIV